MRTPAPWLLTWAVAWTACTSAAYGDGNLAVWPVDPLVKVFRDAEPPDASSPITLRAARNEYESAQLAVRAGKPAEGVRVEVAPLVQEGGPTIAPEHVAWSFVGFIPLTKNTPASEKLQLRAAPCEVPDPLLEARTIDLAPGATQPVWITVRVPEDAQPGVYRGQIAVVAGGDRAALPVELTVDPFTLPHERHLAVTNWFNTGNIAKAHGVELWSEPFWEVLSRYADNMAAHRQNVVYTPWTLVEVTQGADGKLAFDYGRFDRFVELFEKGGAADWIEITHVAHFGPGGWSGKEIVFRGVPATERESGNRVTLGPEEGLAPLLADLERHLAERGWLEKAMIHVADEPSINNIASWREASAFVHRAAPRLRRIDAIETIDFSGALEVWVPKLSHLDRWREAYEARRGSDELWYYICCHPYGSVYPNRFLDYPGTSVRVLHWINYGEDLSGYLHWGLNFWDDDPFGTPRDRLPPGDTHVVYPGSEGPLSSIRWEIQRESLEDYEYLHLLEAKTAEVKSRLGAAADWLDPRRRARELCRRVVPSITEWERDPARIAATRQAIADEIVALDRVPVLVVQTEPPAGSTLVNGPIVVEVRGIVEPGAVVTVGGRRVEVRPDGTFACTAHPKSDTGEVVVEAERDGKTKTTVRRFQMR